MYSMKANMFTTSFAAWGTSDRARTSTRYRGLLRQRLGLDAVAAVGPKGRRAVRPVTEQERDVLDECEHFDYLLRRLGYQGPCQIVKALQTLQLPKNEPQNCRTCEQNGLPTVGIEHIGLSRYIGAV